MEVGKSKVGQERQARAPARFGRIGVLMGGPSSEREISLKSGKAIFDSLKSLAMDVVAIDIKTDKREENIPLILSQRIDCAFLALHGRFGEDGQVQQLMEELKIPYTGSGVSASQMAMDKISSHKIFEKNGLHVPGYTVVEKATYDQALKTQLRFQFPLVVKPATHGSSIGLSIVDDEASYASAIELAFSYDNRVIVEEYIAGRELTVGILDDKALPVIEIIPKKRFFDYEAKYQPGMTEYIVPAQIDEEVARRVQADALIAHRMLGCFGCSRADIILNKDAIPYILEINTIPGFTQTSLLPKAAKLVGIDFSRLCLRLIELAYEKK